MPSSRPRTSNTAFVAGFLACALLATLTALCFYWVNRSEVDSHSTTRKGPEREAETVSGSRALDSGPDVEVTTSGASPGMTSRSNSLPRGPSAIAITLLDHNGEPLPGAETSLLFPERAETRSTDDHGVVEFLDIAADSYSLRVHAPPRPDLVTARRLVTHAGEMLSVTYVLEPFDQIIAGRVLDSTGAPVADARVRSRKHFAEVSESDLVPLGEDTRVTPCDPEGYFAINNLDQGEYELRVFGTTTHAPTDRLLQAGTLDARIVLEIGREIRFHGRIIDPSGEPIQYAEAYSRGREHARDLTNSSGLYSFKRIVRPNESVSLAVRANGYRTARKILAPDMHRGEAEWEVDFTLEKQEGDGRITGRVESSAGEPLGGQRVEVYSATLDLSRSGVSNATGEFRIEGLPEGKDYRVLVRPRREFRDWSMGPISVTSEGRDLVVTLDALPKATLTGEVLDAAGAPVADGVFELYGETSTRQRIMVRTDASGFFEVEEAPSGRIVLSSKSPPRVTVRGNEVEPGAVVDLRFVVDIGPHELHGVVVGTDATPLGNADVQLAFQSSNAGVISSSLRYASTDGEGRFSFKNIGAGKHKITVTARDHTRHELVVDPARSEQTVTISLEPESSRPQSEHSDDDT